MEKSEYLDTSVAKKPSQDDLETQHGGLNDPNHVELKRALKARHITMIGK